MRRHGAGGRGSSIATSSDHHWKETASGGLLSRLNSAGGARGNARQATHAARSTVSGVARSRAVESLKAVS